MKMQGDLISRSAVLDMIKRTKAASMTGEVKFTKSQQNAIRAIADLFSSVFKDIPALDAVPVVHARWIRDDLGNTYCTNCHTRLPFRHCYDDEDGYEWDDEIDETPWCMHCGARMDGEKSEEATNGHQTD